MRKIIVAILGMALAATVLCVLTPAQAVAPDTLRRERCYGSQVQKGSVWGVTFTYNDMRWRFGWVDIYKMCPNGSMEAKMKATKSIVCITKLDDNSDPYMAGFKFKLRIGNHRGMNHYYPSWKKDWDNGAGDKGDIRCTKNNHKNTGWLYRTSKPYWQPKGWFRIHVFPDAEFFWDHMGHAVREYDLFHDPIVDVTHPFPIAKHLLQQEWAKPGGTVIALDGHPVH